MDGLALVDGPFFGPGAHHRTGEVLLFPHKFLNSERYPIFIAVSVGVPDTSSLVKPFIPQNTEPNTTQMGFDLRIHHRRSTRLPDWDYSWSWWYYVTICTHDRQGLFGEVVDDTMRVNDIGWIVREEWMKTPTIRSEVELDDFVIMPNHLHGIVIINNSVGATGPVAPKGEKERASHRLAPTKTLVAGSLGAIIGQFKSKTAKRVNIVRGTPGVSLWQRSFYDHIIRNDTDLHRIRTYIANNPLQWALDEEYPERA